MVSNKQKRAFALGILLILVILGASYYYLTLEKRPQDLIAIVGDQKIFIEDFNEEMQRRGGRHLEKLDKNKLLDEMILRSAMVDQALKMGINQHRDFIRIYENLLVGQYKKQELTPLIDGVNFSADEIQQYYTDNIQKYTQPAKARLAIIYMKTHSKMSDEKKQQILNRMNEALNKAKQPVSGRGFGRISVQYSEDQVSRYKGGDIGWLYENRAYRWDANVLKTGFALEKINDVSDIITTDTGLYIVKLLDRRPSQITPFKKVKERIRHKQLLETRKETEQKFDKDVRAKTPVQIYHDVLDKVDIPKQNQENISPVPSPS
ncbi:MAG: peptidyl-prolyl cis-trans isomerase [Candidatus Magnetomorum sp.]|nr:peptidyl-prolyl cis-trans isomerase [Candidatus Magnetomorum sp.]